MQPPPRILKRAFLDELPDEALPRPAGSAFAFDPALGHALRHPGRIPGSAVRFDAPAEDAPPPKRGVLRGAAARLAETVEVRLFPAPAPAPTTLARRDDPRPAAAPEAPASFTPEDVERLRAAWEAEAEAVIEEAVRQARHEGFQEGYEAARAEMEQEFELDKQRLAEDTTRLEGAWAEFVRQAEPLLADLAFEVARTLLDSPVSAGVKGVTARTITEALDPLTGSAPIAITLHPVDFLRLQESGLMEQLDAVHAGLRWEPSPELKQGDWVVQSPVAMIRRLEEELLTTLRSRLGLLAAVEKRMEGKK